MRICIDAGHGGRDPGASAGGIVEAVLTWEIARRLASRLRAAGHDVTETRPRLSDGDALAYDLKRRREIAAGAHFLVSIHANAFSSPTAHGAEAFVSRDATPRVIEIAETICSNLADLGFRKRGVKREHESQHSALAILHLVPESILVEVGFLTCPSDRARLDEPHELDALAEGIETALLRTIGQIAYLARKPADDRVTADQREQLLAELEHLAARAATIARELRRLTG